MKKMVASVLFATLLWSSTVPNIVVTVHDAQTTHLPIGNTAYPLTHEMIATFMKEHKKELAFLAVAITLGISLKYCSWMRGLVDLDTEAEIDDWRVYIQPH